MISMKEMMLKPRQRPKSPPREAAKSTGPILMLLSSSVNIMICNVIFFVTHDSVLAKEDVDKSNVLIPCIVELVLNGSMVNSDNVCDCPEMS